MDLQDKAIRRFRRHLATLFVLKYTLPLATAYAFVWGTAVLALRAAVGVERRPLLWGLAGLAVCVATALVRARRRMPSPSAIRALLDEQSGCGGLLMAEAEQELGGWRQRMPALMLPRVRWDGGRAAMLLAIAAGFVLLSFLAPQGLADLQSRSPLEVDQEIGRLLQQIALLKGESILEPKRGEMLAEKLTELQQHASGKDPARTLEALDHLKKFAGDTAREAAEECLRQNGRLGEAQALAEALLQNADLLDPQLMKEVLAEVNGLLDKGGLDPELMKALRQQKLDPEQLAKLSAMLRSNTAELARRMEKLHKAGLIDVETLARCRKAGECDCAGLRAFLRDNKGKFSLADLKSQCKLGGQGGISRGPGEAPLTWGQPGSEEGFKFKEDVLPPGALDALKSTPLQEARGGGVIHKKSAESASSGALDGLAAGSGSANTEVILPRHRAAVERYFERKSPKKKDN
ncbi:MAG TPA: hypothetical protein VMG10_27905 [Gemmataceae bacterium]|nr:hypothetical protein [Gemmataceae bacterium]